jgi:hypothetical protein
MQTSGTDETKDLLLVAGGMALVAAGLGLVLSHPEVRRSLKDALGTFLPDLQDKADIDLAVMLPRLEGLMGTSLSAVLPDVERYVKLRSM